MTFKVSKTNENGDLALSVIEKQTEVFDEKNKLRDVLNRDLKITHFFFDSNQDLKSVVECSSKAQYEELRTLVVVSVYKRTQDTSCIVATPKACQAFTASFAKNFSEPNLAKLEVNNETFNKLTRVNQEFSKHANINDNELDELNSRLLNTHSGRSLMGRFVGSHFTNRTTQKPSHNMDGLMKTMDQVYDSHRLCYQYKNELSSKYIESSAHDLILNRKARDAQTSSIPTATQSKVKSSR